MESKILFKYASRSRKDNFFRGLKSITDNLSRPELAQFLFTFDSDDDTMHIAPLKTVEEAKRYDYACWPSGTSKSKIDAINRDMDIAPDFNILINFSDDMIFTVKGFDNIIRELFTKHFPNGDGFLHLNDGHQGENVSTMSIMDRKYYERDRYIYHPEYKSLWCDVEATEVAWMRGCYAYEPIVLFDHLHPAWGLAPNDPQYLASEAPEMWHYDKAVIERHRAVNYGIDNPVRTFKYPKI